MGIAQRPKLLILDEPTQGLSDLEIENFKKLIKKISATVTILLIEHNMDVIKTVDHIIEIGPNGGKLGGKIIFSGSPEELCELNDSPTAHYLKKELT